jgi:hypothetical protein
MTAGRMYHSRCACFVTCFRAAVCLSAAAVAVWRAVSEDYAPFDVDVTTIPPGSNIDPLFVTHACIGGNGSWWGQGEQRGSGKHNAWWGLAGGMARDGV